MPNREDIKQCCGCAIWVGALTLPLFYYLFGTLGVDIVGSIIIVLLVYSIYASYKDFEERYSPQWLKDMKEEERNPNAKYLKKFQEDVYACSWR